MIQIRDPAALARALAKPLDPHARRVLLARSAQVAVGEDAWFAVVEPGEGAAHVQAEVGWPLVDDDQPGWEWGIAHPGAFELAFVFGDLAHVVLVPDRPDTDPMLAALCRRHCAQAAQA